MSKEGEIVLYISFVTGVLEKSLVSTVYACINLLVPGS